TEAPAVEPPPSPTPDAPPADAAPAAAHDEHAAPEAAAEMADEYDVEDARAAGYEVGEATSDGAEGMGVDGKDYELAPTTFEGMEGLDAGDLEALTEVTPAEVGELDMDHDMATAAMDQLEKQAEALEGLSPEELDKIAGLYIEVLRAKLREVRDKTHDKTVAKIQEKSAEKIGTVSTFLALSSLSGLLLLLLPFVQKKKYPGQFGKLFGYSALAASALVLAVLLLTGVLTGMRVVQAGLAEQTNPQVVLQDATFDAVDDNLEDVAAMPGLLLVPLQQVGSGEKEDLGVAILENVVQFKEDFEVFKSVAGAFQSVQGVMEYVPIVLIALAVVLFFVTIKDMVRDVVRAPERAMRGEIAATEVFGIVLRRVGNEIIVTIATLGVLFVITVISAFALGVIAIPAMSTFVQQLMATLEYVMVQPGASKTTIYVALVGVLAFVVLGVGLIVVSSVLYLGKFQGILRARLNNKVPLSKFKPFFTWRSAALLWCFTLPIVTLLSGSALSNYLTETATNGPDYNWNLALLPAPLVLLVIFAVLFVLGYGLKGFLSIARYKVPQQPLGDAALAQAAQALPVR
ncbi:MAG: hypothetical protein HOW73_35105, partial [Polyangiaceae bacterium]|nr:hypothetical protein [Polyangiaceae bacterium]